MYSQYYINFYILRKNVISVYFVGSREVLLQFAVAAPPQAPPFQVLFELLMSIELYFTFKTGCHILSFLIAVQQ